MFGRSRHGNRFTAVIALLLALQIHAALAGNTLIPKRTSNNVISVELTSTDAIAGFQFSINTRGGAMLQAYEGTDRSIAAGMEFYQYLKNDSTLNVVILAPYRSSLPTGEGAVGKVSFTLRTFSTADTVRVFLTGVVICDANAKYLEVSAGMLAWNRQESNEVKLATFALEQNYPNPFNPSTTISYKLDTPANVRLVIYDVAGRLINTLVSEYQTEGRYAVQWNAGAVRGPMLASGMYFARLQVDGLVATKKMILAK
ncbi:MAG: T9SS type A sorting domain-containing protein [Ignavibacteriales bacterium]|nr:T9SS type A sorting domain-containing protein [Ignavibacteriales bacterium]